MKMDVYLTQEKMKKMKKMKKLKKFQWNLNNEVDRRNLKMMKK